MKTVYLIDGFNLIFRCFYAVKGLARKDGFPTNAIHGWVKSLWKLSDEYQPGEVIVVFDLGEDAFRQNLLPSYKQQRKETPPELIQQIPVIQTLTQAMGLPILMQEGIEADDLLAALALQLRNEGSHVRIVSADKDLAQCVGSGIELLLPPPSANAKVGWRILDADGVVDKFGVTPMQIPDYLALIGDTSDNIPGIPGVGPKTAAKWLVQYQDLNGIYDHLDNLEPVRFREVLASSKELLRRNQQLTTLRSHLELPLRPRLQPDRDRLFALLEEMEMKNAAKEAQRRYPTGQTEFLFD